MDKKSSDIFHPTLRVTLARGVVGRCPHCGRGKLYRAYLKQVDHCESCGERFGDIETDDAAPWFTILLTGILAAPFFMLFQGFISQHAMSGTLLILFIAIALVLFLLPRVKGILISAFWFSRQTGKNE